MYNREVLGPCGMFVDVHTQAISSAVLRSMKDQTVLQRAASANLRRAEECYSWKQVCSDYESALRALL